MHIIELGAVALVARSALYTLGMIVHAHRARGAALERRSARGGLATVIIPAFNEEVVLEASVVAALGSGCAELLIVDDGSTDSTPQLGEQLEQRYDAVRYIRMSRNRGKAHALNAGLEAASHDQIVCVDADTILDPEAIGHLLGALEGEGVVAVAGAIGVTNSLGVLGYAQVAEYALECERRGLQALLGTLTTVPGSLGAFRRSALLRVGGYPTDTLIEDTAATLELLADGGRIVYARAAQAWTEVPGSLLAWWSQRDRWSAGFLIAIVRERHWGRRVRLLLDELIAPLFGPWLCLALFVALPEQSAALCLVALCLSAMTELTIALRLQGKRASPLGGLALFAARVGYVWLTSFHLIALLMRLSLRREIAWASAPRFGHALADERLARFTQRQTRSDNGEGEP